jgi:urease subunit alpha
MVGSLEPGKLADIVLWPTNTFGVKPKYVIKGGFIAYGMMGDPNASIPTPEPVLLRPLWATRGRAAGRTSMTFMSTAAVEAGVAERLGLDRWVEPVRNCRAIGKAQMVRNDKTPEIDVDPETYQVSIDGRPATVPPASEVSMSQLYYII